MRKINQRRGAASIVEARSHVRLVPGTGTPQHAALYDQSTEPDMRPDELNMNELRYLRLLVDEQRTSPTDPLDMAIRALSMKLERMELAQ